ncbi:MetQ/NlpA family ABC transporter substrate-binding protein [Carnimonas bestiolae]|uniref:MetQ/NlpA family ABC transporter substrate-binding protein n=1 Tax=Carnimonas bestiolae TaxID=3402172 RepID=UPI003EDB8768
MHRAIKGIALGAGALALSAFLSGCGGHKEDPNTVSVGVMAGPEEELMEMAKQIAKQRYDLNVKIVEFNDYVAPNSSLADGSIDTNAYQHKPYLDAMVKDRGLDLVPLPNGNTFIFPIGGYSSKYKSISELPDGATIAISNDPSNGARALLILEKAGLIKLKNANDPTSSVDDITDNPHHFKFDELDTAQMPRSLEDVDLAFINNNFAEPAGLHLSDALLKEDAHSPYVNLFAVRKGDENSEKIRHLVDAYQSDDVAKKAHDLFGDGAIPGWK